MRRKIIIGLAVLIVASGTFFFLFCFPIILNGNQKDLVHIKDTTQVLFNPLASIDFSKGNNVAYLYFDKADLEELPEKMSKKKILECRKNELLQNLQRDFIFEKSNGDMATCESKILVYKDGNLVFCSSFALTDSVVGIQNSVVGWADAKNRESLTNSFLRFKPTNKVIVKL
jgi:hypothetical protein